MGIIGGIGGTRRSRPMMFYLSVYRIVLVEFCSVFLGQVRPSYGYCHLEKVQALWGAHPWGAFTRHGNWNRSHGRRRCAQRPQLLSSP